MSVFSAVCGTGAAVRVVVHMRRELPSNPVRGPFLLFYRCARVLVRCREDGAGIGEQESRVVLCVGSWVEVESDGLLHIEGKVVKFLNVFPVNVPIVKEMVEVPEIGELEGA